MTELEFVDAARAAAERLPPRSDYRRHEISLGGLTVEQVRVIAAHFDVTATEQVSVFDDGPRLLVAIEAVHAGVRIKALASRPATREDVLRCRGASLYQPGPALSLEDALARVAQTPEAEGSR